MSDRMRVVTKRSVIRTVRDRWIAQYRNYPDGKVVQWSGDKRTTGDIRAALAALNLETCTTADVDAAIGTTGWVENECDICGGDFDRILHVGDEPDYETRWQCLCAGCLERAARILAESHPSPSIQRGEGK